MRFRLFLILIGAVLIAATYSFPLWQPLLVNTVVDEPFPGLPDNLQAAFAALPPEQQSSFLDMAAEDPDMAVAMAAAALEPPTTVQETGDMPEMETATIITGGEFSRVDAVHWAQGTATIYELPDQQKILRLEDFTAANGPDLRVVLSAGEEPRSREEVERGNLNLELGRLKGNIGNQNYEIPPETDLSLYNSVVIYCQAFHVVFSTAAI